MICFRVIILGFVAACAVLAPLPAVEVASDARQAGGASADLAKAPAVVAELRHLDTLYAGMLPWVAQLYDRKSGGFYESVGLSQGREDRPYAPDIQSTHFVVNILRDCGLVETMPTEVRAGLVRYFQSRQDTETGYFSDPDYPEMKEDPRTMGRALIFARGALGSLKSEPLRPLPGQASEAGGHAGESSTIPAHIASVEVFRQWLDEQPWGDAWTALDHLASQAWLIKTQAPELREALADEALRNVMARQDRSTGLIGGGSLIVRISGAFKLAIFCEALKRPIPAADQLWDTVLGWYRSDPKTEKIFLIRNPTDLLSCLSKATGHKLTGEELAMILAVCRRELARYRQTDGGFSSFDGKYYIGPNDLYLKVRRPARAGPQGDLNGTTNAWVLRQSLYRLAGVPAPKLATPEGYWERF